jgi:hypothetical protein
MSATGAEPGRRFLPLIAAFAAYLFWDSALLLPVKLFVVFLHELSHGLAAALSGGSIERIELSADQGGVCFTRGGWRFLVLSAGYLGSLGWGAALLLLGARTRLDRAVVAALGLLTLLVTLAYVRSLFGFGYGLATGAALLAAARWLPESFADGLLRCLGTTSCLYAVWDIASDLLLRSVPGSDANALGALTGVPGFVWGALWMVLALLGTGAALWAAGRPN